jgi:hypothetical protein
MTILILLKYFLKELTNTSFSHNWYASVLLCEMPPLSLFYLLIIFPYEAVSEIMLGFSPKNIYSKKQDLRFSAKNRVTQAS